MLKKKGKKGGRKKKTAQDYLLDPKFTGQFKAKEKDNTPSFTEKFKSRLYIPVDRTKLVGKRGNIRVPVNRSTLAQ